MIQSLNANEKADNCILGNGGGRRVIHCFSDPSVLPWSTLAKVFLFYRCGAAAYG